MSETVVSLKFEELWDIYGGRHSSVIDPDVMDIVKQSFYAGSLAGVTVTTNRIAELPGSVEASQMMQAVSQTLAEALTELVILNHKSGNEPFGTA